MARLVEILLLLAPIAAFFAWRLLFPDRDLSRGTVAAMVGGLLLMIGALIWVHERDAEPPHSAYLPARIENGRIVPAGEAAREGR